MKFFSIFTLLILIATAALAVPFVINVGTSPNMEDGDFARDAWIKQNSNNTWLQANGGGGGGSIPDPLALNTINTVNLNTTNITGNAAGLTNMPFSSMGFAVITNAFTNTVVGFLRFTNSGTVYTIAVGTNSP